MNKTKIEWAKNPDGTPGYTWNPITGCLNGCEYCYARKLANTRLRERYLANEHIAPVIPIDTTKEHRYEAELKALVDPFYPRFWEDREFEPMKGNYYSEQKGFVYRKPKGIFTCDMSDLFGIGIPENWTERVLEIVRGNWQDRFYVLTKQPQNLPQWSPFPDNCWVGVSATNREMFVTACTYLERVWAKVKYLSLEPLLDWHNGHGVDIKGYLENAEIGQVIIGAQTKPTVYPKIEWVQEIVQACDKAGIPVFLKDNLKPLIQPLMRVPNLSWFGNVFGLRVELPLEIKDSIRRGK